MFKNVLVFSDLDGTLLDHHSYSFTPALPMLAKLHSAHIPVIPNTSKTFAELTEIRQEIGLDTPFIVENGAAIYIPVDYFMTQPKDTTLRNGFWVKELTQATAHWLSLIDRLKPQFSDQFTYFSNMSTKQITAATGLSMRQASLASKREYGEPILWLGSESTKAEFVQAIEELGATTLQGGRFLHLSGPCDKGQALTWLTHQFQMQNGSHSYTTIA